MNRYITNIIVNNVFHLGGFNIPIEDGNAPHLIITGKNGSGKTSLLNAMVEHIEAIKKDQNKWFLQYKDWLKTAKANLEQNTDPNKTLELQNKVNNRQAAVNAFFGKVEVSFANLDKIVYASNETNFIIASYAANRKVRMNEPTNPTKPNIKANWGVKETATHEFLNFLSDLKIQEALARNEKIYDDAEKISQWFVGFEQLLKEVFQDPDLHLAFNYKDYSFKIETGGKRFKFTEMSDGFAAVLDIIVDLILKMQGKDALTRAYERQGIVLIDEIETHLHLELQKVILPLLVKVFPQVQFIVTTHSPFVLSSLQTAVAFDLERREPIKNLTEYSYESLAEGYFGVRTSSSYMQMQLDALTSLMQNEALTAAERKQAKALIDDFENIPEPASPLIVGQYLNLKSQNIDKFLSLKNND